MKQKCDIISYTMEITLQTILCLIIVGKECEKAAKFEWVHNVGAFSAIDSEVRWVIVSLFNKD